MLFEETTSTLFCGDLFTHLGNGPALTHNDIVGQAAVAEDLFGYSSLAPTSPAIIRGLAELEPHTLAVMHGSSYAGDCRNALRSLADAYTNRLNTH